MSDSIKELADLNTNARVLLEKHSETLKSVKVVADEAKKSVKVVADEAKKSVKVVADEAKESVKVVADEAKESVKVVADEAKLDIKAFDYMEVGKPQINTNPTKQNAIWLNLQDGSIWVCVDNTEDKNIWVSGAGAVRENAYNTVDIFSDGSCIFYAPFNNADDELTGSYAKKISGNLKQTSNGLLNDSKNNTNAINFKGLNLPDEFSFSAFLQEIEFENDPYSTPIQFELARTGLFFGNRTDVKGKRTISFSCGDYGMGNGYVEIDEGKKSFVVVNVKSFVTQDGNGNDINNFKITGYLNGKKVAENVYKNTSVLNGSTTQRVLLFQESDGTDDNGWDKGFNTNQCFIGYIKNFRIFNRALTSTEAQILSKES